MGFFSISGQNFKHLNIINCNTVPNKRGYFIRMYVSPSLFNSATKVESYATFVTEMLMIQSETHFNIYFPVINLNNLTRAYDIFKVNFFNTLNIDAL